MTSPSIGFVHTVPGLVPVFEDLVADQLPGAPTLHIADTALLTSASAEPGVAMDASIIRLARHVAHLKELGSDVVAVTCSTLGPSVDIVAGFAGVPVLRVDRAMARAAIAAGKRIGVVVTSESNLRASQAIIDAEATAAGRDVTVIASTCAQAPSTSCQRGAWPNTTGWSARRSRSLRPKSM